MPRRRGKGRACLVEAFGPEGFRLQIGARYFGGAVVQGSRRRSAATARNQRAPATPSPRRSRRGRAFSVPSPPCRQGDLLEGDDQQRVEQHRHQDQREDGAAVAEALGQLLADEPQPARRTAGGRFAHGAWPSVTAVAMTAGAGLRQVDEHLHERLRSRSRAAAPPACPRRRAGPRAAGRSGRTAVRPRRAGAWSG